MKITLNQLKSIIAEEVQKTLSESAMSMDLPQNLEELKDFINSMILDLRRDDLADQAYDELSPIGGALEFAWVEYDDATRDETDESEKWFALATAVRAAIESVNPDLADVLDNKIQKMALQTGSAETVKTSSIDIMSLAEGLMKNLQSQEYEVEGPKVIKGIAGMTTEVQVDVMKESPVQSIVDYIDGYIASTIGAKALDTSGRVHEHEIESEDGSVYIMVVPDINSEDVVSKVTVRFLY